MTGLALRSNSPTQTLIDDIVNELGGNGSYISTLDTIEIYSSATLVASLTPTITRSGSTITLEATYTNSGSDITIDNTIVKAGGKQYFQNTTTYTIVSGETKTIRVIIDVNINPTGGEANNIIAKRLTGEQTIDAHFRNIDLITYSGGSYNLIASLTPTITADTVNDKVTLEATYTPSADVELDFIGASINGLTEDPTGPSGYGYLASESTTLTRGVNYTITIEITIS